MLILLMILPIVTLGISLGVSTAKRIIGRGYILWGGVSGLSVMLIFFFIPQYLYSWYARIQFNKIGPCSLCGEWVWVMYFYYWIFWGIGGAIGLFSIAGDLVRAYRLQPETLVKFPFSLRRFVSFVFSMAAVASLLWGGNFVYVKNLKSHLTTALAHVSTPIDTANLEEIGVKALPMKIDFIGITRNYVRLDGLKFDPDGSLLEVRYGEVTEIWYLRTLLLLHQFDSPYQSSFITSFSPDGNYLAVVNGASALQIYRPGNPEPLFQISNGLAGHTNPFSFFMLLRYYAHEGEFFQYDTQNGELEWITDIEKEDTPEVAIDLQQVMYEKSGELMRMAISPDGKLGVFGVGENLEIWSISPDEKLGELGMDAAVTALSFSPDQHILVVATADGYLHFFAQPDP